MRAVSTLTWATPAAERPGYRVRLLVRTASIDGISAVTNRVLYFSMYARRAAVIGYVSGPDTDTWSCHETAVANLIRTRRVDVHLFAEAIRVEQERARPAGRNGGNLRASNDRLISSPGREMTNISSDCEQQLAHVAFARVASRHHFPGRRKRDLLVVVTERLASIGRDSRENPRQRRSASTGSSRVICSGACSPEVSTRI